MGTELTDFGDVDTSLYEGIEDVDALDRGDSFDAPEEDPVVLEDETEHDESEEAVEEETEEAVEDESEEEAEEGEPEDEDTDEPEEEEEVAKTEDVSPEPVSGSKTPKDVPYSRLEKEVSKRKRLENELEALRNKQAGEQKTISEALNLEQRAQQMIEKMAEGDTSTAKQTLVDMLNEVATKVHTDSVNSATGHVQGMSLQERLNQKAAEITERFSVLDEGSEDFDADFQDEVIEYRDYLIEVKHYDPVEALQKATEDKVRLSRPDLLKTEEPKGDSEKQAQVKSERKKAATKKKVDVLKKQPPKIKGTSSASEKTVRVSELSPEDLDSLSEDALAKLRGDYV